MQCCDFERVWNEQLDARDAASAEVASALEAHAASCPSCAPIAARYRTLGQVLRLLDPPAVPADFLGRFLESQDLAPAPAPRLLRFGRALGPLAAAASLFLVVLVGGRGSAPRPGPGRPMRPFSSVAGASDARSLTDALAHAGSATWDLALATSAPAARIGREVLDPTSLVESSEPLPFSVPVPPPEEVLESVGDRVNAGVRPLSGAARHAFGFLLGAPAADADANPAPASSEGI